MGRRRTADVLTAGRRRGPVTGQSTNCSSADIDSRTQVGLTLLDGDLEGYGWSEDGSWTSEGTATAADGGWILDRTEEMGEGDFSLGTMDSVESWD